MQLEKGRKLDGRCTFQGMDVSIETKAGNYRHWYNPHNKTHGKTKMRFDYGYLRGTLGTDGDHLDVFIGPNEHAHKVYIISQNKAPDFIKFDEQKVMLGFDSDTEARMAYLMHYNTSKFFAGMDVMTVDDFRRCVLNKDNHGEAIPIAKALRSRLQKSAQLYIGPRGGRWANPQHTIPFREHRERPGTTEDVKKRLLQKIRRREPGEGREVQLTKQELRIVLSSGRFALVSAGPNPEIPEDRKMSPEQAKQRHGELKRKLVAAGYMHTPVVGHYGGREDSFLVMIHDAERRDIRSLGQVFKQDSVIYADGGKNELHFTHGDNADKNLCAEGKGWQPKPQASDFFTRVKHPDGTSTKFSLNLDFDHLKPCNKAFMDDLNKGPRPPAGYQPAPNSKHGGYRKKIAGRWDYWYPEDPGKARTAKEGAKPQEKPKGAPERSEGAPLAPFEASRADPSRNPGLHKLESGQFKWMRSRTYEMAADGKNIRSTKLVPNVDDHTKMQVIQEFGPLIRSEAKRAFMGFGLKARYEMSGGKTTNEVLAELQRGGTEGILNAIRDYRGGKPFAPYAKMYVRDYVRLEASRQVLGGHEVPEMHMRNLRRFIAARVKAGIRYKTEQPTPEQIAKVFDLRYKHIHKDVGPVRRNELVPLESYKLQLGRHGMEQKVRVRGGGERTAKPLRDVVERRGRQEWAALYDAFLKGQKDVLSSDDAERVFSEMTPGMGMTAEDLVVVRNQIDMAMGALKGLGDAAIVKGTPGSRKKPTVYSVVDLGEVLKHRLGLGVDEHSIRQLAEVIPVYRKNAAGDWVEISERSAHPLLQEFVEIGMGRLKESVQGKTVAPIIDRVHNAVVPKGEVPAGPTYTEQLQAEAKKYTAGEISGYRDREMKRLQGFASKAEGDTARSLERTIRHLSRMSSEELAMEMARKSRLGRKLSAEMRRAMTSTIDVERIGAHDGVAYVYDPATKTHRSFRVKMNYDKRFEPTTPAGTPLLRKSFDLNPAMMREVRHWPLTMDLMAGRDDDHPTMERYYLELLAGVR